MLETAVLTPFTVPVLLMALAGYGAIARPGGGFEAVAGALLVVAIVSSTVSDCQVLLAMRNGKMRWMWVENQRSKIQRYTIVEERTLSCEL
jgi:hypothetical protein